MGRRLQLCLLVMASMWVSTPAAAQFNLGLGAGLQACTPNGEADCESTLPFGHLWGLMEYRFGGRVGWSVEYDYGAYWPTGTGSDRLSLRSSHLMTVVRGYFDYGLWNLYGGVGMGLSTLTQSDSVAEETLSSFETYWAGLRLSVGALRPWDLADGLHWGVRVEHVFHLTGETCVVLAGAQDCRDTEDSDVSGQLQVALDVRYVF